MTDKIMESIDVSKIYENALKDPDLFSTMDIDKMLESIENEKNAFLENKTIDDISNEVYSSLEIHFSSNLSNPEIILLCNKLAGYRYVDEIYQLERGRYIRWIRKPRSESDTIKVTNGAILMDIKFLDNGVHILCKTNQQRFIQVKFDECLFFQKLSMDEELILLAYQHLNS